MIIDTCGFVPTRQFLYQWFDVISRSRSYLRTFWKGFAGLSGLSKQEYFALFDERGEEGTIAYLRDRIADVKASTPEAFVAEMDAAGIRTMVLHNGDCETFLQVAPVPFEVHAELAQRYPGRFFLLAGIDPLKKNCVATFERCVRELGYGGLLAIPFRHGFDALDERWQPLFRKCQELGVPAWIHSTTGWDPRFPTDHSSPRVIDKLAIAHPELTILAGHAGWPWIMEMVVVAWRHPNVFMEVSAFRPKNMADPDYGFGPLLYFGKGPLQDKVMFGSTWHMLNLPLREVFDEVRGLPISQKLSQKWLHDNARRALRLG